MTEVAPDIAVYPNLHRLWHRAEALDLAVDFVVHGSKDEYDWQAAVLTVTDWSGGKYKSIRVRTDDNWYDDRPKERRTRGFQDFKDTDSRISLKKVEQIIEEWGGSNNE